MTSSVAGLITSSVPPTDASRHSPSMNSRCGPSSIANVRLSRPELHHLDASGFDELAKARRRSGERGEGAVVHRHDLLDAKELASDRRFIGTHGEQIADRQKC